VSVGMINPSSERPAQKKACPEENPTKDRCLRDGAPFLQEIVDDDVMQLHERIVIPTPMACPAVEIHPAARASAEMFIETA